MLLSTFEAASKHIYPTTKYYHRRICAASSKAKNIPSYYFWDKHFFQITPSSYSHGNLVCSCEKVMERFRYVIGK